MMTEQTPFTKYCDEHNLSQSEREDLYKSCLILERVGIDNLEEYKHKFLKVIGATEQSVSRNKLIRLIDDLIWFVIESIDAQNKDLHE